MRMEDVAVSAALALHAHKLIFMTETPIIKDVDGNEVREVTSHQVEGILKTGHLSEEAADYLRYSAKACIGGTPRAHTFHLR